MTQMKIPSNPLPSYLGYLRLFEEKLPALSGYIYAVLAHFSFTLSDFFIKKSQSVSPAQAYYIASLGITMILFFTLSRQKHTLVTKSPRINIFLIVIGFFSAIGGMSIFFGFRHVPLSEGVVTLQSGPAIASILAVVFLKESYDLLQFFSTILCTIGVAFILKPPFFFPENAVAIEDNSGRIIGTLAILVAAFALSSMSILQKKVVAAQVIPVLPAFYIVFIPSFFTSFLQISSGAQTLDLSEWMVLVGNIVSGCSAQIFMNRAFKFAEAGKISLMGYTQILFAYIFDIFLLGTKIDFLSAIGSGFIFGCVFLRIYKTLTAK